MTMHYFRFEEDFVEDNVRCIPMIARFKLDTCGVKLKLAEWSRMSVEERSNLAENPCHTNDEVAAYKTYVRQLVRTHVNREATLFIAYKYPLWENVSEVPSQLLKKCKELNISVSLQQWKELNYLQRFALIKLSVDGHENKNLPKALKEFKLTGDYVLSYKP
jgi:hypothetical protein